jgi:hypothetical protein
MEAAMPIVSTTKQITCPRCGTFPATLTQNDYYATDQPEPVDQRFELECVNGCAPTQKTLRDFRTIEIG